MNPRFSVIMPTYNTSAYVKKAIESILIQSDPNFELIIIDDASNDNTVEIIKGFDDYRISLMINPKNNGPSFSRNRGLNSARGEWIMLIDSDDWIAPERLERLYAIAIKENLDMIADDQLMVKDGETQPWSSKWLMSGLELSAPQYIDAINFIELELGFKPIIRRDFLNSHKIIFDESLSYGEDYLLFLSCLIAGAKTMIIPEGYYYYRSRSGSLITNKIQLYSQSFNTTKALLDLDEIKFNPNLYGQLKKRLKKMKKGVEFYSFVEPLKQGKFSEAALNLFLHPQVSIELIASLPKMIRHRMPRMSRNQLGSSPKG